MAVKTSLVFNFYSDPFENKFNFFKDVKFCPDAGTGSAYRIYWTKVSPQEFKAEVWRSFLIQAKVFIITCSMLCMGTNMTPRILLTKGTTSLASMLKKRTMRGTSRFQSVGETSWVPTLSPTTTTAISTFAPVAGKALASGFDVFDSSYKASLVAHSQGNYVLRITAQNISDTLKRKQVFENIFISGRCSFGHVLNWVQSRRFQEQRIRCHCFASVGSHCHWWCGSWQLFGLWTSIPWPSCQWDQRKWQVSNNSFDNTYSCVVEWVR